MTRKYVWRSSTLLLLLLYAAGVTLATVSSIDMISGISPETTSTSDTGASSRSAGSKSSSSHSTSTASTLPPTTTYPPLIPDNWSNMTLEFFIYFVSIAGGLGVIVFIIVMVMCCRDYKLLDTDDDSDSESVRSSTPIPSEDSDHPNDTTSQTEHSWDVESVTHTPQENVSPQRPRRRPGSQRHHRSRSRSRRTSAADSDDEEVADGHEFWGNSF
ncbi:hypothetical protein ABL78_7212 [Leptomonas seymouri]|uniref:Uncharacterized protein n=1 Tax=Leptomonas seymouri TaxID=5684 RepID=A0A0N0P356_LEPSE|nr:hypothetical protein ABL78_7212 [Leptomonas seymouri]|eukprot:KPI83739.1 hypothetical protein ABL78_7212 [Leptomonas seymouri]